MLQMMDGITMMMVEEEQTDPSRKHYQRQ